MPAESTSMPDHVVVMGVSGCGKSTVATELLSRLEVKPTLGEGDDFHPAENVQKMSSGHPLTDEDRWPWLRRLVEWTREQAGQGKTTVLTCSALRRVYRDVLREADPETFFLHLHGDRAVLLERLQQRPDHFMPASLLDSQLDTLEPLEPDERGAVVDIGVPLEETITQALGALRLAAGER